MQKQYLGRQKVEMAKIKKDSNLQVTFSKRRAGLFKKASELCTLCGAQVGIVVFSPGNKVFSFGHPGIGSVIDRYLNQNPPENSATTQIIEAHRNANVRQLNLQLSELLSQLEYAKNRGEELKKMRKESRSQHWWEAPIEELSLQQLLQLKSAMEELEMNVGKHAEKLVFQSTSSPQFFMGGTSSSGGAPFHDYNANMMPHGSMMPQRFSLASNMIPPGYSPNPQGYINPGPPELGRGFL